MMLSVEEQPAPAVVSVDERYRLSRHVAIRPTAEGLVAECAVNGRQYSLESQSLSRLLLALARPVRLGDLLDAVGDEQRPAVLRLVESWREDGLLTRVDEDGAAEEDRGPRAHWEFHDLLFHARSRRGRTPGRVGATFPLRGVTPQDPAVKAPPPPDARSIELPQPDLDRLRENDVPLTRVLEERRSRYSAEPVELARLAEFLFRTARVTDRRETPVIGEVARKVYPSGGSLHSLELYVVAWDCRGLDRAVYHYRAAEHRLVPVAEFSNDVELLLQEARTGTGNNIPGYSPVLFVVTARFQRVMWKYQALSYRVILAELGGLYQTMYLVATAMGLSPSAIGTGDSDRFARITGLDYYREASVGEFVLGGPLPGGKP
jgi:SagB-type dehydrogenase family enzyme